jgi:DNA polymerase I-like protein with 3'-5' exonuclease and polymerase domains
LQRSETQFFFSSVSVVPDQTTAEEMEADEIMLDSSLTSSSASSSSLHSFLKDTAEKQLNGSTTTVSSTLKTSIKDPAADNIFEDDNLEAYLESLDIKSRPKPGGAWNVRDPLHWTRGFGCRSPETQQTLDPLIRLQPGNPGYFDVAHIKVPRATIVRTKEQARIVLQRLYEHGGGVHEQDGTPRVIHACDTEVMAIDLKSVGPVGNGYVTCVSIYSGPDFDYGLGDGPGTALWIDNLDDACGVLQEFKDWFQDEKYYKVWHNYGFDRHVMWNEGIDCRGFGGDTMHMARLLDTSRSKSSSINGGTAGTGYSLEALTQDFLKRRKKPMKEMFGIRRLRKDGSEGTLVDIPPVEEMQRDPAHRTKWIMYSCFDAEGTWLVHQALRQRLEKLSWFTSGEHKYHLYNYYWNYMRPFAVVLTDMERRGIRVNANDYLAKVEQQARKDRDYHCNVFREWAATKMDRADALALNLASAVQLQTLLFGGAENAKTGEKTETERIFKVPREEISAEAFEAYQLRDKQLANDPKSEVSQNKAKNDNDLGQLKSMNVAQLKTLCKDRGLKVAGKKAELQERLREHFLQQAMGESSTSCTDVEDMDEFEAMSDSDLRDSLIVRGLPTLGDRQDLLNRIRDDIKMTSVLLSHKTAMDRDGYDSIARILEQAAKKEGDGGGALSSILRDFELKSEELPKFVNVKITSVQKLQPVSYTAGGAPSVTADVIRKLAGDPFADPPKYGLAYEHFGKEGCEALFSLCSIGSIDTMIANFLTSLQELADHQSRVHCSLNLNTETGRLSSRRPNLQNQPALEKDKYKIRKAFEASPGNNFIVADYGQLELRILASITYCQSMIDAFESGGDFHSRTAVDMFDYVKQAVDSGEVLLEWDYSKGDPPKPMVKDKYASERRKAKTLNFSIAYGKTAHGLSQDWGVSKEEAEEMLQKWYAARPEVLKWQLAVKQTAKNQGVTRTLMGRYRQLPEAMGSNRKLQGHAERASINTPIQGGAADIAMMAMNKINESKKLEALGWVLLLQIHDEVILEGPEETAEEAFEEVLKHMEAPWVLGLNKTAVPLVVDGTCKHKTWYDAK